MRSQLAKTAIIAAAVTMPIAVPAHAEEATDAQVLLHVKDHSDLALAWDGESAVLAEEGDEWSLRPVEALLDLGVNMIVHESTGQCLSAAPMEAGATTASVRLAECAEATQWTAEYDDDPSEQDWRFSTSEGDYLGIEHGVEAAGGTEVVVVAAASGGHAREWTYTEISSKKSQTTAPPTSQPPSSTPSGSTPPGSTPSESTPPAAPKLPTTGTGIAAGVGIALLAIGAGVGMLAWRRRALGAGW